MAGEVRRMRRAGLVASTVLTVALVAIALGGSSRAQEVTVDGVVDSAGLRFPDGTTQTRVATWAQALLSETGQQLCWDSAGDEIACADTGQDGETRAGLGWPSPRFVDNSDGTISDKLTGLIWLQDANCPLAKKMWQEALDWVASFNAGGTACTNYSAGTFSDWRLPNISELGGLVDFGTNSPALPPGHLFLGVQGDYWSSTTLEGNPLFAWKNAMIVGLYNVGSKAEPTHSAAVWAVRGGL